MLINMDGALIAGVGMGSNEPIRLHRCPAFIMWRWVLRDLWRLWLPVGRVVLQHCFHNGRERRCCTPNTHAPPCHCPRDWTQFWCGPRRRSGCCLCPRRFKRREICNVCDVSVGVTAQQSLVFIMLANRNGISDISDWWLLCSSPSELLRQWGGRASRVSNRAA